MSTPSLLPFAGLPSTSTRFRGLVVAAAADLGTDPNWMLAVMRRESGYRPDAVNEVTGATGLIQFMPSTAVRLGTSVDELVTMTREEQVHFVWRFYRPFRGRLIRPVDVYLATFAPKFIGAADDVVLFGRPIEGCEAKPRSAYCENSGLDADRSGAIEVRDLGVLMAREIIDASRRIDTVGFLGSDDLTPADVAVRPVGPGLEVTIKRPGRPGTVAEVGMVVLPSIAIGVVVARRAGWSTAAAVFAGLGTWAIVGGILGVVINLRGGIPQRDL